MSETAGVTITSPVDIGGGAIKIGQDGVLYLDKATPKGMAPLSEILAGYAEGLNEVFAKLPTESKDEAEFAESWLCRKRRKAPDTMADTS